MAMRMMMSDLVEWLTRELAKGEVLRSQMLEYNRLFTPLTRFPSLRELV